MRDLGEWRTLSLDATYKVMMSVIGQARHGDSGCGNRDYSTCHTIRGETGSVPGMGIFPTGGIECSIRAIKHALPETSRKTVQFIFVDQPSNILEGHGKRSQPISECLPNLRGVGEDPMRLVFRCESCTGETRTAPTRNVMSINLKFDNPHIRDEEMEWGAYPPFLTKAQWEEAKPCYALTSAT